MKLNKLLLSACMVFLIPLFLISCGSSNEDKLTKIKEKGEIILGTSADYPPYEFPIIENNGNEKIVGFDILIAEEIAKDLGVNLVIKNLDFSGLLDALNSNSVDFIMSGITPTEERKKSIDFSDIYYTAENILLTLNNSGIESIDDLDGKTVGVQLGSIQDKIAQDTLKNSEIKSLIRIPELILELLSNKVDAIIIEVPVAKQYMEKNPELSMITVDEFNPGTFGSAIGIKKGQEPLLNEVNNTISRLQEEELINDFYNQALELTE